MIQAQGKCSNLFPYLKFIYSDPINISAGQSEAEHMIGPVLFGDAGITPPPGSSHFRCGLTNVSECQLTNMADKLAVLIYNPLPRKTSHIVRIPLGFQYKNAKVYDDEGNFLNVKDI